MELDEDVAGRVDVDDEVGAFVVGLAEVTGAALDVLLLPPEDAWRH